MKSRHSIEIKGLLEQAKIGNIHYNPQSSTNLTACSVNNRTLKRSESNSILRRTDTQISMIQGRYRALEQNYKQLLEETRLKGDLFRKQKEEMQRYRQAHERDQKEIMQLRSLLDIARKTENIGNLNKHNSQFQERSQKSSLSVPKQRSPFVNKGSQLNIQLSNSNVGTLKKNSRIRFEVQSKQPFSRYKFVPTLPLK